MNNQLIFTEYTLTDANLYGGVNYAHDINTANDLNLGVAAAASVSFVIDNAANDADKYMGKSFTWKCKMFSESVFKTMGIFNVYSVVKNKSTATIAFKFNFPSLFTCSIAFSNFLASILKVSLTSTNIGVAPSNDITSAEE